MTGLRPVREKERGGRGSALPSLRELICLGPSDRDFAAAFRLSISVGLTLPVLLLLGLPHLCMYAVFGAFVGMYGRDEARGPHLLHQLQAALMLLAAVLLGSLLASSRASPWALICIEGVFAAVASLYADRFRLNPGGPFFGLFALGACASAPPGPAWLPPTVFAASTGVTLAAGLLRHSASTHSNMKAHSREAHACPLQASRYLSASLIAGGLGCLSGWGHAYWAVASSAVPFTGPDLRTQVQRGLHRVVGTFGGLGLTLLILWMEPKQSTLIIVMIALLFPTEYFMRRNYGCALLFFTPPILLMTQLASPGSPAGPLIMDRALQTLLGATVGVAVGLLLPRSPTK